MVGFLFRPIWKGDGRMTDDKWNAKLYDEDHSFVAKYGET